jgi:hypothetical protein
MNARNKPAKKNLRPVSPQVEALVREAEDPIRSWIQDTNPLIQKLGSLSSEEQEDFFLHLIKRGNEQVRLLLEALAGKDEKLDLALSKSLGYWISPPAADLLRRMSASAASKIVSKSVRKSIFRLKSKGLAVEDVGDRSPAIYHPPPPAAPEGFLSSIDSAGNRMVWLARPQIPPGMAAFTGAISDTEGIVDFNGLETSRKNFHEYVAMFQEEYSWEIVEADPAYCLGLFFEAAEIGERKGKAPPAEFLKWRPAMGPAPALPLRPLIYEYLKEEEAKSSSDLLDHSASLFQVPFFQTWFLEKEESQKYLTLLREASASRLVLTPYQKESRLMEIYRQAFHELFTGPRRLLYRRRLEEMAYVLWKKGLEKEARMSLAAAGDLEKESGILSPHPFGLELVKRSLLSIMEEEKEKKSEEPGLIIRP